MDEITKLTERPRPVSPAFCLWTIFPLVSGSRKARGFLSEPGSANGIFVGAKKAEPTLTLPLLFDR